MLFVWNEQKQNLLYIPGLFAKLNIFTNEEKS